VAETRGQFENLEKGEHPPMEAVTRGLLKEGTADREA
jgi:hypothetical protein